MSTPGPISGAQPWPTDVKGKPLKRGRDGLPVWTVWPVDRNGTRLGKAEYDQPDFASADWPTGSSGEWLPVRPDGTPAYGYVAPRNRMRLPGFVVLLGVIAAAIVALLLPVHDNFGVSCPSPGAVGAVLASKSGFTPAFTVPGVDETAIEDPIVASKVNACHSGGETRLVIAGVVLIAAVIGSRFVPDVGQRTV